MELDKAAFDTLMEEQKTRARKAREALGDLGWAGVEFGKDMPATQFLGYESHSAQGKVLALVAGEELREELGTGAEGILVRIRLPSTPRWAARWPTTAWWRTTASASRSATYRRTRAGNICTTAGCSPAM